MRDGIESNAGASGRALVPRSDFIGLERAAYFYSAAEGPMLASVAASLQEYAEQKSRAEAGRAHHGAVVRSCKEAVARLLGASEEDVALLGSASEGINAVAGLVDFRSGDNVVTNDLEFPSAVLPWLRLEPRGVEVRVLRHQRWDLRTDDTLQAVDERTRLVALSHVSYINGLRHDIDAIGRALRGTGTVFLVDATQSAGVLPISTANVDFLVASSYKWLLGTHGLGILYWNQSRQPDVRPASIGRQSVLDAFGPQQCERYTLKPGADRFTIGFASLPAIYSLSRSVPYLLDAGIEKIERHVLPLGDRLMRGLADLGLELLTPAEPARRGASISFAHGEAARVGEELAARDIFCWAGQGRVRVSLHLFNDAHDLERLLAALAEIV